MGAWSILGGREDTLRGESAYFEIISGRRRGLGAALARLGLAAGAGVYGAAVGLRNFYYGRWALPVWLEVPVISVGNLTVGGTGKTPMTVWLCERLLERGRKPAVLSRGYKSEQGMADELLMLSRKVPKAVAIANPDRTASGRLAIQEYAAKAAVLDDGFQHRRVGRDLDIVLVDATRPFGFGHLLPRGLLREPLRGLRRAEAVVLTRVDQVSDEAVADIERRIRGIAPDLPIVKAVHRPAGFYDLSGARAEPARGSRLGAFCGIARPDAFLRTLQNLGYRPAGPFVFADHHAYTARDGRALVEWARRESLEALVTTEKDAVKLADGGFEWPVPVLVLRVEMALLDDGDKILCGLIDAVLKEHEEPDAPETSA